MARPSLKDQRTAEILDAYLRCVARFGLEGATQDRIAAQAGLKRPMLRHYLGNKDDMVQALADHVIAQFDAMMIALETALDEISDPQGFIALLFLDEGSDPDLTLAWQSLAAACAHDASLRAPLLDSQARFLGLLQKALQRLYPHANADDLRAVSQGLVALFGSYDALTPLQPPTQWGEDMKQAAHMLMRGL
jgi:AcrR family transcriptional regulator